MVAEKSPRCAQCVGVGERPDRSGERLGLSLRDRRYRGDEQRSVGNDERADRRGGGAAGVGDDDADGVRPFFKRVGAQDIEQSGRARHDAAQGGDAVSPGDGRRVIRRRTGRVKVGEGGDGAAELGSLLDERGARQANGGQSARRPL